MIFTPTLARLDTTLVSTVRAADCILTEPYCHCTLKAAGTNSVCIKPVEGKPGQCFNGTCAAGVSMGLQRS